MKFITPAIILALSIGMYLTYLSPSMNEVQVLNIKKSRQVNILSTAKQLANKRDAISTDYNNISGSDIDKLNKIIPESFSSVLFINDISGMAGKSALTIKEFKVDEPKTEIRDAILIKSKGETYKTTTIKLKLRGQYSQFVKFVSDLESSLRLVDIEQLSIKPIGGQGSSQNSLEYLLEMNTYSLR